MKLLVVRHAIAEDTSPTGKDEDRPLSLKGREIFWKICKSLNHLDLKFDLLLDSPLLRSQQTADIFCEHFFVQKRARSSNLKPLSEVSELFLEIKAGNASSIVVIGHQPFLTKFINYCVTKDQRVFILLKRGGMAFLEFPLAVKAGYAIMEALLSPRFKSKQS